MNTMHAMADSATGETATVATTKYILGFFGLPRGLRDLIYEFPLHSRSDCHIR